LFFNGDDWDVLKEEVKTYLMAQSAHLDTTIILFICVSIVYPSLTRLLIYDIAVQDGEDTALTLGFWVEGKKYIS
jgi:hypothetical protein